MKKKFKPKAYSVDTYEIKYKCSQCETKFNMRNDDYNFCYKCGTSIDWGVTLKPNIEYFKLYYSSTDSERKQMLQNLDERNSKIPMSRPMEMIKTDEDKLETTNSNISYYLGIGWTKDELISKKILY